MRGICGVALLEISMRDEWQFVLPTVATTVGHCSGTKMLTVHCFVWHTNEKAVYHCLAAILTTLLVIQNGRQGCNCWAYN